MVLTTLDPKTALVVIDLQKASLLSLKCTRSRKSSSTRASWRRRSAAMACRLCSSMSAVHPRDARSRLAAVERLRPVGPIWSPS